MSSRPVSSRPARGSSPFVAYRVLVLYHCGAVCKKLLPEALQPPQGLTLRGVLDERTGGNLFVVLRHQAGASRERARRGAQHLGEWSTECWVSFPFPRGRRERNHVAICGNFVESN